MNLEVKFCALKGYIGCKISILNSKVDLFIESLKETITKVEKREATTWKFFRKKFVFYSSSFWQRTI